MSDEVRAIIARSIMESAKAHPMPQDPFVGTVAAPAFFGVSVQDTASYVLAALRSEGWEVYRPDHETKIWWCRVRSSACNTADCLLNPRVSAHAKCGYRYLLVPVPAESEEGL